MTEPVRVMYVDDEPDIRTIVEFALEDEPGMALQICSSGAQALEAALQFLPDIVLLDVMMPGMDGPTTLQHLKVLPELANTRFAFVTAKVQPQEVAQFKAMGATAVIAKPFDPMALADQVWAIRDRSDG